MPLRQEWSRRKRRQWPSRKLRSHQPPCKTQDCPARRNLAAMAQNPHQSPELSSRLKKSNDELKSLQGSVKTGMINVKVLMDFRNAAERARQASAAVQQWLETQGKGNDPYKLMSPAMSQRLDTPPQLFKQVPH